MRWRGGLGLLVFVGAVGALFAVDRLNPVADPCENPPVLAAGAVFADDCIEMIRYADTTYYVDCVELHPSRIGARFLSEGGDTYFAGAADIEAIPRSDAFILEGGQCRKHSESALAISDSFTRLQAGLLKVPVDHPDPLRQARKLQPWIVPGHGEIPEALELEAVLTDDEIAITNLNDFAWRSCDQFQIDAPDDEWSPWKATAVEDVAPGETVGYPVGDFDRDSGGSEQLSADGARDLVGSEVVVMCRAPKGPAFGAAPLQER